MDPQALAEVARVLSPCVNGEPGRYIITGIGLRSDVAAVQRIYSALLGGSGGDGISGFACYVAQAGFRLQVVDAATTFIRMPVLILQETAVSDEGDLGEDYG